jgi:hypothetical protein
MTAEKQAAAKNEIAGASHPERRFASPPMLRTRTIGRPLGPLLYVTWHGSQNGTLCSEAAQIARGDEGMTPASRQGRGRLLMDSLVWLLIVIASGFTASAIAANLYRMSGFAPETTSGHFVRVLVLMFAGPSEIFETAVAARIAREGTAFGFWLAITGVCYWSLLLGLILINGAQNLAAA